MTEGSIPWMQEHEAALTTAWVGPEHTYLEWGSGGSTAAIATRAGKAFSIEHDSDWYRRVQDEHGVAGVERILCRVDTGHLGWSGGFDEGSYEQFRAYVDAVDDLGVRCFDRVLVDGRARGACAVKILPYLGRGSLVFVHDFWIRPHYWFLLRFYEVVAAIFPYQSLAVLRRRRDLQPPFPAPDQVAIPQPTGAWRRGEEPLRLQGRFLLEHQAVTLEVEGSEEAPGWSPPEVRPSER